MQIKKNNAATVKDKVYKIIKEMIFTQKYQLGEKINIDTLATTLNASNSPIRESLIMLEKQGLVKNIPNVGFRVISFSPVAYHEICTTLFSIVFGAYELCIRQNTIDIAIENMRSKLQLQKDTIDSADMYTSAKSALEFDKSIILATQNAYLLSFYEHMEDIFFLMAIHSHQRDEKEHRQNIYEHSMILESIENNDFTATKHWLFIHYNKHV